LRRAIRRTRFAADAESTRYALAGALWEISASELALITTDGRRLARMPAPLITTNGGTRKPPTGTHVVPILALKMIEKLTDGEGVTVRFSIDDKGLILATDTATLYSRLVEGRFPKYQDVFPTMDQTSIHLSALPLLGAVKQAAITTSAESRAVDFEFGVECLTLRADAPTIGSARIEMAIPHMGPVISIAFDPHYLEDALMALDPGVDMDVKLYNGQTAATFTTDDGYQYVMMPMSRDPVVRVPG